MLLGLVLAASAGFVAPPTTSAAVESAPKPTISLSAVAVGTNQVDLVWGYAGDTPAAAFLIRRDGKDLATVDGATQMYVDRGVAPAKPFTYVVEALDATGRRLARSHPAVVKTPRPPERPDRSPPAPPEDFTVTPTAVGNLLDWYDASDDTDVTGYRIYRDGKLLATVDSATLSYLDTTADPATAHTYTLEALDPVGHRSKPEQRPAPGRGRGGGAAPAPTAPAMAQASPVNAAAGYAAQLRRYPYLTDVVDRYATINWATDRSQTTGSVT
ncbi:MAG: hypothetical protein QJR03_01080 [Sphaerobacter sp.]|nr:hypothetical protein [Sphaerobacter sp.]